MAPQFVESPDFEIIFRKSFVTKSGKRVVARNGKVFRMRVRRRA